MPLTLALGRQRQKEISALEDSLVYPLSELEDSLVRIERATQSNLELKNRNRQKDR